MRKETPPDRVFYADAYNFSWDERLFPARKYENLRDRLLREGVVPACELGEPQALTRRELLKGHRAAYLDRLEAMTREPEQGVFEFEAPCTRRVLDGYYSMGGGTLAACRAALSRSKDGLIPFAANLGGGFHHAFPWKGEGFCAINDIAISLNLLLEEGVIGRAAVLDLDVHQGNGTAKCFELDPSVFTCSLHQEHNFPVKQKSDLTAALEEMINHDGPFVLDVEVPYQEHVLPMIPGGMTVDDMILE